MKNSWGPVTLGTHGALSGWWATRSRWPRNLTHPHRIKPKTWATAEPSVDFSNIPMFPSNLLQLRIARTRELCRPGVILWSAMLLKLIMAMRASERDWGRSRRPIDEVSFCILHSSWTPKVIRSWRLACRNSGHAQQEGRRKAEASSSRQRSQAEGGARCLGACDWLCDSSRAERGIDPSV